MILQSGDAEMWCDRCGAEIPIGCDILTDKEVRVGLGCWEPQDGWQSAGSKLYHFFTSERIALLESRDETTGTTGGRCRHQTRESKKTKSRREKTCRQENEPDPGFNSKNPLQAQILEPSEKRDRQHSKLGMNQVSPEFNRHRFSFKNC